MQILKAIVPLYKFLFHEYVLTVTNNYSKTIRFCFKLNTKNKKEDGHLIESEGKKVIKKTIDNTWYMGFEIYDKDGKYLGSAGFEKGFYGEQKHEIVVTTKGSILVDGS